MKKVRLILILISLAALFLTNQFIDNTAKVCDPLEAKTTLNQSDIKIVLELFFEILLYANKWCNVEVYLNGIFSDFFFCSQLSDSEILAFQTK